jgi:hypothetical protein
MKIYISKHISLNDEHPELPEWLFLNGNTILPQTINKLDEPSVKEFLLFLNHYATDFDTSRLHMSVVAFSELMLEYS